MWAWTIPGIYRHDAGSLNLELTRHQNGNVRENVPSDAIAKIATVEKMGDSGLSADGLARWGMVDALIREEIRDPSTRVMIVIPGDSRNQSADGAFDRH